MLYQYALGIIVVLLPIPLLIKLGPPPGKERLVYFFTGLLSASFVGLILFLVNFNETIFEDPDWWIAKTSRVAFAGLLEELFRYPAILFAQFSATYLMMRFFERKTEESEESALSWSRIKDPHGMGFYFGVGWGLAETIGFYIYPAIQDYVDGVEFEISVHVFAIILRVTAVMAHTALTFIALVITVNKSFYRFTISLHIGVNVFNEIFNQITPEESTSTLVVMFTRFLLVVIAYYLLRPRSRYLSPGVLLLILVLMFIGFVVIGSFFFLLTELIKSADLARGF